MALRSETIQIGFEVDNNPLQSLIKDLDNLKKQLTSALGGNAFDDLTDDTKKARSGVDEVTKSLKNMGQTNTSKTENGLKKISNQLSTIGKKAAGAAFTGLKKLASISFKGLTVGITAAAGAVGALLKSSVSAYSDYEQLIGGVETLFKDSSEIVQKNANNAFKTSGLSANAYMETVTSFSASLIQSLGGDTEAAAKLADQALVDMSDNANKLGTSMESIQYAYQGFAKQNYTMLDNLKLGYGGTKSEMERLVKDAAKLDKSIDANSLSYSNVVKAVHAVQESLGITGTTAKEAEHTISGSLSAMKSAWSNLLPSLIKGGDSFDQCVDNLVNTISIFGNNIKPAITKAISGLGTLIEKFSPIIEEQFPVLVKELLPPLIKAATALVKGLIKALPSIIGTIAKEIPYILGEIFGGIAEILPGFSAFKDFIEKNTDVISKFVPALLGIVAAFMAFKKIKSVSSVFSGIFGKSSKAISKGNSSSLLGGLSNLAKIKKSTIIKALANITIIATGLGAMIKMATAAFPDGVDFKLILEVIGAIGILGGVGAGLTKLAGIVGKIPISTVVKGLANIAIIVAGIGALIKVATMVFPEGVNFNEMLKLIGLIGILGTVGSILTVFAGIVGMIPFPVVLTGLANIALVLGGFTAIVAAFGALSQIEGFNDFIQKGGEVLTKLCNILGDMVGSLIGGIGEGISKSLPTIGENISKFVQSLTPMFSAFQGVDMSGVGNFFSALGGFLLQLAGENLISFFTGGSDLTGLGTKLNTFAKNAEGFFTKVATFPAAGFENAKLLFESLSGIGNLPGSGGVVQWFAGEVDYAKIAAGLGTLSGESVTNFFNMAAGMKQEAFDNSKKMFEALSGIGSLPGSGGLVQWFTGEVDYAKIAAGLGALSGDGVKSFFQMAESLSPQAFENTTALFNSLANIDKLPDDGGVWGWLTGEGKETDGLTELADGLSYFGEKASGFFNQVNSLNIDNLNGLWDSLKKPEEISTNTLEIVAQNVADIVKKVSELPVKMGEGIRAAGNSLKESLVSIWEEAANAMAAPVNKIIEGANWVLEQFGSDNKIASWTPYARGTTGHKGGNALVNDGRGAELVQMPNGRTFIPQGKNVFIPNAPKGMKVLPAEQTARLIGKKSPTFHYANGTGDIDIWSYIDNASGLVNAVSDKYVNYDGLTGFALNAGKGLISKVKSAMSSWTEKLFDEFGAKSLADYVASAGVEQWRSTVIRALKMEGQYSESNVERTLFQMQTESGGNPKAINLWDSNAQKGIPSKGLMQVIDPTFNAYARAGFNSNIYDPLSNILASIRYAVSRYGSLGKAYQGHGYANGVGSVDLSSYTPENSSSTVINSKNKETVENNSFSPVFNLTISGTTDDRVMARKVQRWVKESINEMYESMNRKNPAVVRI